MLPPGLPDLNPHNFYLLSYITTVMYGCTGHVDHCSFRDKLNSAQICHAMKGMHVGIY